MFTDCPPGPLERLNRQDSSVAGIASEPRTCRGSATAPACPSAPVGPPWLARGPTGKPPARELFRAGYRTPRAMSKASWQDRVDGLGRGHYRRYDERTSTMLGDGAHLVMDRWKGDLRRMRDEAGGATGLQERLTDVPGIGPTGADIFCREVQGVWSELAPYVDKRAADGAARVGLPRTPARLASYASAEDFPRLVAACVRATLDDDIVRAVRER